MSVFNLPWTLRQAIDRGMAFYPVKVDNWGDASAAQPDTDTGVDVPVSIADSSISGIAIAPDSTVERCAVSFNPMQLIVSSASRSPGTNTFVLTKDAPYVSPLGGVVGVKALLDQCFTDTFTQEDGTAAPFGGPANLAIFQQPRLSLNLLLRPPGIQAAGRASFQSVDASFNLTGGGAEDIVRIVPVGGRRRARVSVFAPAAGAAVNFRVTGVQMTINSIGAIVQSSAEFPLAASAAVLAAATGTAKIDPVCAQWLVLRADTAGAAQSMGYSILLED